jgi:RimJ/RimL family protein N-acetyltransferase
MFEITPFQTSDAVHLDPQHQQAVEMGPFPDWRAQMECLRHAGPCWTGRLDGQVIGAAGLILHWHGRASVWCMLNQGIPRRVWPAIHAAVRARIALAQTDLHLHRIEAEAAWGFLPGLRWLRLLGFEQEGLARAYGPDRRDFVRFAKVMP